LTFVRFALAPGSSATFPGAPFSLRFEELFSKIFDAPSSLPRDNEAQGPSGRVTPPDGILDFVRTSRTSSCAIKACESFANAAGLIALSKSRRNPLAAPRRKAWRFGVP
jgi:hypothetical protein